MSEALAGRVPFRDTDTSREAAARLEPVAAYMRALVLQTIRRAGANGLTAHEAADVLGLPATSTAPRCTELRAAGLVRDGGGRRTNASGRRAIVWVAADVPESYP